MNTKGYLEAVRKTTKTRSDYAIAKALEVSPQAVSKYFLDGNVISDAVALKVAVRLGVDPAKVLIDIQIERSKSPEAVKVLRQIVERLAATAAAVLVCIPLISMPETAFAAHSTPPEERRVCILCQIRRKNWFRQFLSFLDYLPL